MNKQCAGCVVSAGTHKPAEALHKIEEPKPNALSLLQEYRKTMPSDLLHLWASDACDTIFRQHERIAEMESELEAIGAGGVEPLRGNTAGGVRCHDADACAMGQLPCPTPWACNQIAAVPQECARSHPHEEMTHMCELRTEIARLTNALARAEAQLAAVNKTNTRN